MSVYDLIIRGGMLVTAEGTAQADIAIKDGRITAAGQNLGAAAREISANGMVVTPGGVDTHCHVEQISASGLLNADTFESATASALHGGTTTIVPFAAQHIGLSLTKVVADYHALAAKGAMADYAFNMILADPNEKILKDELPPLIEQGLSSIKIFMTYDKIRLHDEQILDVLLAARNHRALVTVHAENHGMIAWFAKKLIEKGYGAPKFHGLSHPRLAEAEAFHRMIAFSEFIDQPVMFYHVSTAEGAGIVRKARGRGLKIFAETCPHYLFLTRQDMDKPGMEGAKFICSPPLREPGDQEALWQSLRQGDIQVVSSDHAPYAFDATGKLMGGPGANFKQVPNGMPGLEWRQRLMFDAATRLGKISLPEFVRITATDPAKIYGLHPRKGSLAPGSDADVVIWNPGREETLSDSGVHDKTGYNPFAGRVVRGVPEIVIRRGEIVVEHGALKASRGSGLFLPRDAGEAAKPSGKLSAEFDPARNSGAELY